jgi:hypothetical protein
MSFTLRVGECPLIALYLAIEAKSLPDGVADHLMNAVLSCPEESLSSPGDLAAKIPIG